MDLYQHVNVSVRLYSNSEVYSAGDFKKLLKWYTYLLYVSLNTYVCIIYLHAQV